MIGEQIELLILEADGETVKVGIKAPKHIQVFRKEIYESIQAANKEALNVKVEADQLKRLLEASRQFDKKEKNN